MNGGRDSQLPEMERRGGALEGAIVLMALALRQRGTSGTSESVVIAITVFVSCEGAEWLAPRSDRRAGVSCVLDGLLT